jgi:hypothetical protein
MSIAYDPEEVISKASSVQPYLRLWASVFRQGLQDAAAAIRWKNSKGKKRPNYHQNWCPHTSLRWLESDVQKGPGSLLWLCDLFDIDPDAARNAVYMNWRTL